MVETSPIMLQFYYTMGNIKPGFIHSEETALSGARPRISENRRRT